MNNLDSLCKFTGPFWEGVWNWICQLLNIISLCPCIRKTVALSIDKSIKLISMLVLHTKWKRNNFIIMCVGCLVKFKSPGYRITNIKDHVIHCLSLQRFLYHATPKSKYHISNMSELLVCHAHKTKFAVQNFFYLPCLVMQNIIKY